MPLDKKALKARLLKRYAEQVDDDIRASLTISV